MVLSSIILVKTMWRIELQHVNNDRSDRYLSRRSEHNSSNFALVIVVSMCLGPSAVAVMNGKL